METVIDMNLDGIETWVAIYKMAGEKGLMEYSRAHHNPMRGLGESVEIAHFYRLSGVASEYPLSANEFYRIASKLPENFRSILVRNPNCPESLIEDLWVGNYVDGLGNPFPNAVICGAFYHNHYKMRSIYARRPDLRVHVPEYVRRMTECSLREDGEALLHTN